MALACRRHSEFYQCKFDVMLVLRQFSEHIKIFKAQIEKKEDALRVDAID